MPIDWYTFDEHTEPFTTTQLKEWGVAPDCPKCGKRTEYQEGQIGETEQGWAIEGYWFMCFECCVESDIMGEPRDGWLDYED